MVGSNIGWRLVPYVAAPAGLAELAAAVIEAAPGVRIVPGLADTADVMRGEEVQLLGAVASGLAPDDALLCQPGTHCKWARVAGGRVAGFTTALTGEVFALLRGGSVLAHQIGGAVGDGAAFRAGVQEGARGDLLASLFGIRARGVLGLLVAADAASFASGVLIGSDVAARIGDGAEVHLIADPTLGALYQSAIETLGGRVVRVDSEAAFLAGITALWRLIA